MKGACGGWSIRAPAEQQCAGSSDSDSGRCSSRRLVRLEHLRSRGLVEELPERLGSRHSVSVVKACKLGG